MTTMRAADLALDPTWSNAGRPHGGFVLSEVTRRGLDDDHPHPLAVSAHFLAAPDDSLPATVQIERLRTGRRVAATRLQLVQSGAVQVGALLSAGRLDPQSVARYSRVLLHAIPPPDACDPLPRHLPNGVPMGAMTHLEARLDPATGGWVQVPPDSPTESVVRAWLRRRDGRAASPLDLVVFVDAVPHAPMSRGFLGASSTVELTFYLRALPAPGWIQAEQRSLLLQDGWLDQTCLLWDSRGQLVAQGHQLIVYDERRRLPAATALTS